MAQSTGDRFDFESVDPAGSGSGPQLLWARKILHQPYREDHVFDERTKKIESSIADLRAKMRARVKLQAPPDCRYQLSDLLNPRQCSFSEEFRNLAHDLTRRRLQTPLDGNPARP